MTKAIVLGGNTGLLGQSLVKALANKDWEVAAYGREDGNIFDSSFLGAILDKEDPDIIFNTIAWTQVDEAEEHPQKAAEINSAFPDMLARLLSQRKKGHLAHFSTDFVFSGQPPDDYWHETDKPEPTSVYGSTKLEGENAIARILPDRSCIIRTAWLYGPGRKNFVETILNAASQNDILKVVDDQRGCPTYAPDLADWSIALAREKATGIWHAVNSGHTTWCELAQEAIHLASLPCRIQPIKSDQWPQKAKRPQNSIMDTSKLTFFLGYKPRPWLQALRDYVFGDYLARSKK